MITKTLSLGLIINIEINVNNIIIGVEKLIYTRQSWHGFQFFSDICNHHFLNYSDTKIYTFIIKNFVDSFVSEFIDNISLSQNIRNSYFQYVLIQIC
mgnify:CR=1 FL=1